MVFCVLLLSEIAIEKLDSFWLLNIVMFYSTLRFRCCVDSEECFDIWLANAAEKRFDMCRRKKKMFVVLCTVLQRSAKCIAVCFNL